MIIEAAISPGELFDKITILEIKLENISDHDKLLNVRHEYNVLNDAWVKTGESPNGLRDMVDELRRVNASLWKIEDDIREKERAGEFDQEFIALARAVYRENDRRAEIKKRINLLTGSELIEEKSYAKY